MAMIAVRRALGVAVLLVLLAAPASALATHNDDFVDAVPLDYFEREPAPNRSNVGAGEEAGEPLACGVGMGSTIWYVIPGNGGPVTVHTRGSTVDTVVAVYDTDGSGTQGNGPPTFANRLGCNDDIRGGTNPIRASEVTFDTDPGLGYLVQVGGCVGDPACGAEQGTVEFIAYDAPSNDDRGNARPVGDGTTDGDNVGATLEPAEPADCDGVPFGRTVWFRYTALRAGRAIFTSSGIDTVLSVYRDDQRVGCNDDGPGESTASRVEVDVTAGDYLVQVGGIGPQRSADFGNLSLNVQFVDPPAPQQPPPPTPPAPPLPPPPPPQPRELNAEATLRARPTGSGIRVRWLRVRAPSGARVVVVCGRRCRFSRNATVASGPRAKAAKTVSFSRLVGRRFRAGTRIRIYVTKAGSIGKYFEYRVRRGNFRKITRCLAPGTATSVTKCP